MEVRKFEDKDYDMVVGWWKAWGWPPIPEAFLSGNGFIVSNGGTDICAGWLYSTDSAVCWAENYISNKAAIGELRRGAIEFLVESMAAAAKEIGFLVMMSSVKSESLKRKLLSCGFNQNIETGMTNLTRVL